jgi:2-oxoglutarate ferredoxin oxidoreductase subunit gamma
MKPEEKMKNDDRMTTLQFSGFGGQGIVLSSVIFGTAAVTRGGYNGVQTSSYGSEARGGECQAELILSKAEIHSPLASQVDVLVSMSQLALNTYLPRLKPGKTLIIDPELVEKPDRSDIHIYEVPATRTALDLGFRISANMVMLGFLQQASQLISEEDLLETIKAHVPAKFLEVNLKAAARGKQLAKDMNVRLEI